MTVVSTLINIDFYKTTSGVRTYGTSLELRRPHYLRGCASQSNSLVKWKTSAEIVARDSRGETEGGNAYLLYSAHSTSRPSITKLLCRLQKRRKNQRSLSRASPVPPSLVYSLPTALSPSLSFLDLPSRWIVFTFGDPVSREIIAGRRILIVATYDLLRYVRFIFVLTRPEWRFKRCCGGRPWTSVRYDLHFILMSALNGYRLLRSVCSQLDRRHHRHRHCRSRRW